MSSCRKDESCSTQIEDIYITDTIYPSPYLSTYPGSWWEYTNGTVDSCTAWESVPQFHEFKDANGCTSINRTWSIVPKVNDHFIYNNSLLYSNPTANESRLTQQVGDFGSHWSAQKSSSSAHITTYWKCDSIFTNKEVNGVTYADVIMVTTYTDEYYDDVMGGPPSDLHYYYYAKNVGLIMKRFQDAYLDEIVTVFELEDYYIAPH